MRAQTVFVIHALCLCEFAYPLEQDISHVTLSTACSQVYLAICWSVKIHPEVIHSGICNQVSFP